MTTETKIIELKEQGVKAVTDALKALGLEAETAASRMDNGFKRASSSANTLANQQKILSEAKRQGVGYANLLREALERMTAAEIKTASSAANLSKSVNNLKNLANAAAAAVTSLGNVSYVAGQKINAFQQALAAGSNVARAFNNAVGGISGAVSTVGGLVGKVGTGFANFGKQLQNIGGQASTLTGILGGLASALSIRNLITSTDDITSVMNTLRQSFNEDLPSISTSFGRIVDISRDGVTALNKSIIDVSQGMSDVNTAVKTVQPLTLDNLRDGLTKSAAQAETLFTKLMDIANNTAQPIKELSGAFASMNASARGLGISEDNALEAVNALSKGFYAFGIQGEESGRVLRQINQVFSKGVLQAEEFNQMMETSKNIVNLFGVVTGKTTAQLRQMMQTGQYTARNLISDLVKASPKLSEAMKATTLTISGALTQLNNGWLNYLKSSGAASTANQLFVETLGLIANNLTIVIPMIGAFVAAFSFTLVLGQLGALITMLSNPFTAAILAAVAAFSVLVAVTGSFGEAWARIKETTAPVINWMVTTFQTLKPLIVETATVVGNNLSSAFKLFSDALGQANIPFGEILKVASAIVALSLAGVFIGISGAIKTLAEIFSTLSSILRSIYDTIVMVIDKFLVFMRLKDAVAGTNDTDRIVNESNNLVPQSLKAARNGASWRVSGAAGVDNQIVSFRASPGERVIVQTPHQQATGSLPKFRDGGGFTVGFGGLNYFGEASKSDTSSSTTEVLKAAIKEEVKKEAKKNPLEMLFKTETLWDDPNNPANPQKTNGVFQAVWEYYQRRRNGAGGHGSNRGWTGGGVFTGAMSAEDHASVRRNGVFAARDGLDMLVPGAGAVDSRFMPMMVSPGESVHVRTPSQRRAAEAAENGGRNVSVVQNFTVRSADDLRRSQQQVKRDMARAVIGAAQKIGY